MALVSNRAKTMDPISPNRATPMPMKMVVRLADSTWGPSASCSPLIMSLTSSAAVGHAISHLAEHVFDDGVARQDRLLDGRSARNIVLAVFLHLVQPPQELVVRHGLAHRCEVRCELVPEQVRHLVDIGLVIVANEVDDIELAEQQALVEIADRCCRRHIPGAFDDLPNDSEIRANGLAELGQTLDRCHSLLGELFQIGHTSPVESETDADLHRAWRVCCGSLIVFSASVKNSPAFPKRSLNPSITAASPLCMYFLTSRRASSKLAWT